MKCVVLAGFLLVLPARAVFADVITSGVWSMVDTTAPAGTGVVSGASAATPFWNGVSWDSTSPCTAAALVGGQSGNCLGVSHEDRGGLQVLTTPTGGATPFEFESAALRWTVDFQITAFASSNKLGWYDLDSAEVGTIFGDSTGPGSGAEVSTPARFGFWYQRHDDHPMFLSGGAGSDQFALFRKENDYWLGVEDLTFGEPSDWDFNDFVVHFRSESVPEPGTLALMACGLVGALAQRRLRSRARA